MLLNDVGTLLIAVQFHMSLYNSCRPVCTITHPKVEDRSLETAVTNNSKFNIEHW